MWKCRQCNEQVDDEFEACWNCGASIDGVGDPTFRAEPRETGADDEDDETRAEDGAMSNGSHVSSLGMSRPEIAQLICKTLALLMFAIAAFFSVNALVVIVVLLLTMPMRGFFQWHELSISLVLLVPATTALIVGAVYWKFAPTMARGMVANDPSPITQLPFTVQDLMIVAFATAGAFIVVAGAKEAVTIAVILYEYDIVAADFWLSSQTWSAIVQLSLGLWLMLGSRGIANFIHWLRHVRWKVEESTDLQQPEDSKP